MEPFRRLEAVAAPLERDNVDTDALFPGAWIQRLDVDYAEALFAGWRSDPDFVLNDPRFAGARILVAGESFGIGSSREHAVWSLAAYGFRCVVAVSFGDIFHANCFKNGLLPIALPAATVADLRRLADGRRFAVDLEGCRIEPEGAAPVGFAIEPERRRKLLAGLDDVGETLAHLPEIEAHERRDRDARPWVYAQPPE